jgi:hypothetical protein
VHSTFDSSACAPAVHFSRTRNRTNARPHQCTSHAHEHAPMYPTHQCTRAHSCSPLPAHPRTHAPHSQEKCIILGGKEIVSRFSTTIKNVGGELLTDSNGREMLQRRRNYRPTWDLNQTEPVAGNYYPCNAAAAIRDNNAQLTVLVDASQGVASIEDGQIEFMVHRRVFADDHRGVGEPLDETEHTVPYVGAGHGEHKGRPLVIRGRHTVTLLPPSTAAATWRPLADRVFSPPLLAIAIGQAPKNVKTGVAMLSSALPTNVQIVTLQSLAPGEVLLRLAHQFGVGEDALLSQPAEVDLALLFNAANLNVTMAREVSLTNNQNKTDLIERRAKETAWSAGGRAAISRARRGGGASGVDEVNARPHWWRRLPALDWSVGTVVTLGPLEIKTFVLSV